MADPPVTATDPVVSISTIFVPVVVRLFDVAVEKIVPVVPTTLIRPVPKSIVLTPEPDALYRIVVNVYEPNLSVPTECVTPTTEPEVLIKLLVSVHSPPTPLNIISPAKPFAPGHEIVLPVVVATKFIGKLPLNPVVE